MFLFFGVINISVPNFCKFSYFNFSINKFILNLKDYVNLFIEKNKHSTNIRLRNKKNI